MSLRFRKRIKIMGGVYLNLSKNGLSSVSLGKPGLNMNIGKNSTSASVGIPGTGLSYRKYFTGSKKSENEDQLKNASNIADNLLTEIQDLKQQAAQAIKELEEQQQKKRETLDALLKLNKNTELISSEKFWKDVNDKLFSEFDNVKPLFIKLDWPSAENYYPLLKAIATKVDNTIFIQNTYAVIPALQIKGLVLRSREEFGRIYTGSGMGTADQDLDLIGLDLNSIQTTNDDLSWAKKMYLLNTVAFLFLFLVCLVLLFYAPGFWPTLWGLIGTIGLGMLIKKYWQIFFINPLNTWSLAHGISRQAKKWQSELNTEKANLNATLSAMKDAAYSSEMGEALFDSIQLLIHDLELQVDFKIGAGLSGKNEFCLLLKLPEKESIEVVNKLTPGGKESVEQKSSRELNTEYAIATFNLAFFVLARAYSAYPSVQKIKIAAYSSEINEATGNAENKILFYNLTNRESLLEISFANANSIQLAKHLNFQMDMDGSNQFHPLNIDDIDFDELKTELSTDDAF